MIPATLEINTYRKAKTTILLFVVDQVGDAFHFGPVSLQVYKSWTQAPFIDIAMTWTGTAYTCELSELQTDITATNYNYHLWQTDDSYPILRGKLAVSDVHTNNAVTIQNELVINNITNTITVSECDRAAVVAVEAAAAASTSEANAETWAEGDDAAVVLLGGEKSSKGWAVETQSIYDTDIQPNLANINTVVTNIADVNTVADNIVNVNNVGGSIGDVNTVAANEVNINKVADNEVNITKVADNEVNINAVAANETNINAVNTNEANINTVSTNIADVQTVSTNIADVNFVATAELEEVESTGTTEVTEVFFGRASGEVREGNDLKFGDVASGNYTEIEADGTIKFHGDATVFRDEMHTLIHQSKNNAAARMVDNIPEGSLTYKDNATTADYAIMSIQLNHDRKNGADVYPHLHWWQTTTNMPNWLIEYRWQRNGQTKVTAWTEVAYTANAFTWVADPLNQITSFTAITPPTGDDVSDILQIKLSRDVAAGSTIYTTAETSPVDQDAVSLDVHIEIDTIGSREEYIK